MPVIGTQKGDGWSRPRVSFFGSVAYVSRASPRATQEIELIVDCTSHRLELEFVMLLALMYSTRFQHLSNTQTD